MAKIGEHLVPPIKRQLSYMCCYSDNIEDLENQVEELGRVHAGIKLLVDYAERNLQIIGPDVWNWLSEVERIRKNANELREDTNQVPKGWIYGSCPNLKLRYKLSRRAKKMTKECIQLQERAKFERVSYPPLPGEMVSYPDPPPTVLMTTLIELDMFEVEDSSAITTETEVATFESDTMFRSRKITEERVLAALQDHNVNMIGLCGMGGVGKTTMVRRIEKMVKESKIFDVVVMAVVTQQQDSSKIQNQIAEMLGLKLDGDNLWARAKRLHNRIMNENDILVILDDVWGRLDLMEIGIPNETVDCPCKILLTSRARDVCVQMGAQEILSVEVLSVEEAWTLFSEEAGISHDSCHPYLVEKEVANECKGLPIALISVARALKGRSNSSWEDALVQLKRSIPINIPGVLANVYRPLELSYSHLEGNEAKNLFILCSLLQENSSICIEDLVRYGMGLNIFESIQNLREGRNRAHALIEILKDRFLLVDGHKEGYVKMHDVICDIAISIRSRAVQWSMVNGTDGWWSLKNSCEHCTHASLISSISIMLPKWLTCPNMVFLLWECNNQKLMDPETTFERLTTLNVLDIHHLVLDFPAVPSFIQNLKTLHLCNCKLGNISMIGYLLNLEILSFRGSDIKILPKELGKLCNLRLLDLTDCEDLQKITSGVIAGLVKLEELYLPKSFNVWHLGEFKWLCNLTTLRIVIRDNMVVTQEMQVFSKLKEYDISIGVILPRLYHTFATNTTFQNEHSYQKVMDLYLPEPTLVQEWVKVLLKSTEDLRLSGDGSSSVMLKLDSGSQYLKQLRIQSCTTVEHIAATAFKNLQSFPVFPVLESLFLKQLPNIEEICLGKLPKKSLGELRHLHLQDLPKLKHILFGPVPNVSFSNLRSIYIYDCQNLQSLFCISVAISLLQLEELEIGDCEAMEKVFSGDGKATTNVEFKKVNKLVLRYLNATEFATVNIISFPQLEQLKMDGLPRFKGFCPIKRSLFSSGKHEAESQILFNEEVACPSIKRLSLERLDEVSKIFCHKSPGFLQGLVFLKVDACHRLKTIFSPSIAHALVKLKELRIWNCGMLAAVIEKENEGSMDSNTNPGLFCELEYLEVTGCPILKSIFPPSVVKGLVKLKEMRVLNCEALEEVIEKDEQEQMNINATPFPQLRSLQLTDLPNVKSFWWTNYDFEIPSLINVRVDKNSPVLETLSKTAKNADKMKAYRDRCKLHGGQVSHTSSTPCAYCQASSTTSANTMYASCQSYVRPLKEEREYGDLDIEEDHNYNNDIDFDDKDDDYDDHKDSDDSEK